MFKQTVQGKILKFLLGGSLAALINIILMIVFIENLGFNSSFLRNIANIISLEISLVSGFFIYRLLVWTGGCWNFKDVLLKQLPLYHISSSAAIFSRILIVFPILDWLQVNYILNTIVGVLVSFTFNYLISDRLVFRYPTSIGKKVRVDNINYPEGLSPALVNASREVSHHSYTSSKTIGKFSLVIPAYNEEGCIVSTVTLICQTLEKVGIPYEVLVVNDNSRDRTEELLQQLSAENPQVRYINNYYPNGFGFAVRCGLENFKGDAVAIVMADNSDAPENMIDYYQKLQEGYDCVFGSRFIKGGKVVDYPTHKLIVNRLANLFIQVLFGLPLNDTTNAFKAYRKEVIEGIFPLVSHHFNLTVEIPLKAITRGYSYCIIPITWQNRTTGVSKLKLKEMGSRYLFVVLSILLEKHLSRGDYVKKQRPLLNESKNQ